MKSQALHITFTQQASQPRRRALLILAVLLAGCCVLLWQRMSALNAQLSTLQSQQEEMAFLLEKQREIRPDSSAITNDKVLRQMQQQLAVPWQDLWLALDQAALPGVSILALTPNAAQAQVRLLVETESLDQALRYVDKLEDTAQLSSVYLLSQQPAENKAMPTVTTGATASIGSNSKMRFTLLAQWGKP